jgi:basic membrane lipoprotein Med (substrate-binding protein (PBP1-ABC) superfamily)
MRSKFVYVVAVMLIGASLSLIGFGTSSAAPRSSTVTASKQVLRVALLTSGPINDGSFNQFAYAAMQTLQKEGLVKFVVQQNMADPSTSTPLIHEYAAAGYDLIIGHGIELSTPIFQVAKEYPKVHFLAIGALNILQQATANVDTWTYDFGQDGYLMGYVGGKIAGITHAGIVNGPKLSFIEEDSNGIVAGMKASNPKAKVQAVYTASFDNVQAAQQAASGLIAGGAQLVFTTGDGIVNGVAAAAAADHVLTMGVTGSAGGLAKKVNVAEVNLNCYPLYLHIVQLLDKGKFGHLAYMATIENDGLILTNVNRVSMLVPANLEGIANKLVSELKSGEIKLPAGL